MGVYTKTNNLDLETGIIECAFEPGMEAALNIVAESEMNYNAIMQAVGIHELSVLESTGVEMVYEAGDIKGFASKIKQFFINLLEKVKGLFKKFFAMLDSFIKTDKDFVEKYKRQLLQVVTTGFEYKGFKFNNLDYSLSSASSKMDVDRNFADDDIPESDKKTEIVEAMRGTSVGETGSLEASEFAKHLFKFYRSGEDSKVELPKIEIIKELNNISGNSKLKTAAEESYKSIETAIKAAIKESDAEAEKIIKKKEDASEADVNGVRVFSTRSSLLQEKLSLLQLVNGAKLTAIKDQNRQSKAICVSLMNYKPKHEGYSFTDSTNESFLSGVVLR